MYQDKHALVPKHGGLLLTSQTTYAEFKSPDPLKGYDGLNLVLPIHPILLISNLNSHVPMRMCIP